MTIRIYHGLSGKSRNFVNSSRKFLASHDVQMRADKLGFVWEVDDDDSDAALDVLEALGLDYEEETDEPEKPKPVIHWAKGTAKAAGEDKNKNRFKPVVHWSKPRKPKPKSKTLPPDYEFVEPDSDA